MKIVLGFLFDYIILILISVLVIWILKWNFFTVFLGLIILHFIASFRTLHAQDIGGVLFFGDFVKEVEPGIIIVPVFCCRLVSETGLVIQRQFPDEPENIDKTGNDIPAKGKVFPVRVTHAEKKSDDPLDRRITSETTFIVRFKIKKGHFKDFYTNIGSIEEAIKQMRDAGESQLKIEHSSQTVAEALKNQESTNDSLRDKIEKLVAGWGTHIEDVHIIEIGLNHAINIAIAKVPESEYKKKATITDAEAEKEKQILEGTGKAEAEKLLLEAKAIGYKKIATELGITEGDLILKMETMKQAMEKAQYSIIPGSDAFQFAAGLSETLKKLQK